VTWITICGGCLSSPRRPTIAQRPIGQCRGTSLLQEVRAAARALVARCPTGLDSLGWAGGCQSTRSRPTSDPGSRPLDRGTSLREANSSCCVLSHADAKAHDADAKPRRRLLRRRTAPCARSPDYDADGSSTRSGSLAVVSRDVVG